MEKRKFLNLCGKRDRALLSGEKRMTLGDMERLTYLTEFLNWRTMESPYGKNLVMM
ncbi:hypothetical protein [Catenibacterium sp.]|uniref:hypothetical protein n=1 Tax=Catenibacterium sp. TaxID=2049022 RepID=UPI0039912F73